jgi:hypothetical protein
MKVLGFKDWYSNKEKSGHIINNGVYPIKICEGVYKAPKKILHIEIDILSENIDPKRSKNSIDRFYLNPITESYSDKEILQIKNLIKEAEKRGNKTYLIAYDFTSSDPKKCYKNSIKLAKGFKEKINIFEKVPFRGMGSLERINEAHLKSLPTTFYKQRLELIECYFDVDVIEKEIELPFYFNPNDSNLLEKYQICLKNILTQYIISNESFEMQIKASKPWTSSKKRFLIESIKENEDLNEIYEMIYPDPNISSLLYPQNKPRISSNKISILKLTEKRAKSVCEYLSKISEGMPIKFVAIGEGYKEGDSSLKISINQETHID